MLGIVVNLPATTTDHVISVQGALTSQLISMSLLGNVHLVF